MKAVKYLAIVLGCVFFVAGCQKEFSLESPNSATGSLKDTSGNCLPITANGTYRADSTLTDSNFIVVQVRFYTPGSYMISTDTSNGFSFKATGSVKDTGLNSIKLMGTGKPAVAQVTNFFVAFDSSVCMFSIPVGSSLSGPAAVYTLAGSPDNCSNANVQGNYEEGSFLTSANTVSIQVNVDTMGIYSIIAGPANGIIFSAQGLFTSTGVQTVTLQGSGTPAAAGTTTVPLTAGGTSCSFTVTINANTPPGADSAWQFSGGSDFYHGFIDTALTHTDTSLQNATALSFYGSSSTGSDTLFQLDILLPGNTIQTGTYNTDSANADFYLYNTDTSKAAYFRADYTVSPAVNIQVNINTYDPATGIVTGTFSGTAENAAGQIVKVNGGKIYAKVD